MSAEFRNLIGKLADPGKGLFLSFGASASYKENDFIYVSDWSGNDFVKLERYVVANGLMESGGNESLMKRFLLFASVEGGVPAPDSVLHELFPQKYVILLNGRLFNAITCSSHGSLVSDELFPDSVWIHSVVPGVDAALASQKEFADAKHKISLLFVQNYGVFAAADTVSDLEKLCYETMAKLAVKCDEKQISTAHVTAPPSDPETVRKAAPELRGRILAKWKTSALRAIPLLELPENPITPFHFYVNGCKVLNINSLSDIQLQTFEPPGLIRFDNKALFAVGRNVPEMQRVVEFAQNAADVRSISAAFGEFFPMADTVMEKMGIVKTIYPYPQPNESGPLAGRIVLITGGSRGLGLGISSELIKAGAYVVIANQHRESGEKAIHQLERGVAVITADISDEKSIAALADAVITRFGGIDLLVSNAGILKAGSVKTLEKTDWDLVTSVDYTAYFLCVKHFAPIMARQNAVSGLWSDIVQINSQSGLSGSKRNAAYAAAKFGTVGMTQSFALELVEDHIKVNSICPGNLYDSPLWTDPENGLFRQHLEAGNVPGAKTIEEVRKYYLERSPIHRGCEPVDVARAVLYAVCQQFETGQAIPVTGGQVMLH